MKKKSFYDTLKEIRNTWFMNPVTRVQDNKKKDKKKARRDAKNKIRREDYNE